MQKKDSRREHCKDSSKESQSKKGASVEFGKEICPNTKKEEKRR